LLASYQWVIIPLLSGLIGWFTNWLAVKMLFRPRLEKKILGFALQGVIPKRRSDIAQVIGQTIEKELLTHGDLQAALKKVNIDEAIKPILQEKINIMIDQKLTSISPLLVSMLPKSMIEKIKASILEEILKSIPELMEKLGDSFINNLPISELVVSNINKFDLARLEKMIIDASNKELKFIEYLGGVVGFLIGLIQVGIMQILQ
jgi:uncharacterized membrane protein YheB (UPF0754 family)